VPASSPAALADALVEMMRDPAELRRLGQAGRRRAETHFDIRRMVGHYEAMYEAALAGGRCN
jgi:glycosyltransferase involved in cell wall biosynthesis